MLQLRHDHLGVCLKYLGSRPVSILCPHDVRPSTDKSSRGESWHRLRQEDFSQVDWQGSDELLELIKQMMRTEPSMRLTVHQVCSHAVVARAREIMEDAYKIAQEKGTSVFAASSLARGPAGFLEEILGNDGDNSMDLSV